MGCRLSESMPTNASIPHPIRSRRWASHIRSAVPVQRKATVPVAIVRSSANHFLDVVLVVFILFLWLQDGTRHRGTKTEISALNWSSSGEAG